MLVSIIIPTYESEKNINNNLKSIKNQIYKNYEIIVVDNCSKDKTLEIVKSYTFQNLKIISETDDGIYDAVNIDIKAASGDLISILHSDDYYYNNNVLNNIVDQFKKNDCEAVYSDLIYVKKNNHKKILIYWKSQNFSNGIFFRGWSPPHPTFIVKRSTYNRLGYYMSKFGNSTDIELMYRYLQLNKIKFKYFPSSLNSYAIWWKIK